MLMESLRIALAICSAGRRAGSAPITAQQTSKNPTAKNRLTGLMTAHRTHARQDCQQESFELPIANCRFPISNWVGRKIDQSDGKNIHSKESCERDYRFARKSNGRSRRAS